MPSSVKNRAKYLWECDAFLTVPEIAQVLGVERSQINKWAHTANWKFTGTPLKPYIWTPRDRVREIKENPEAWKVHCRLLADMGLHDLDFGR